MINRISWKASYLVPLFILLLTPVVFSQHLALGVVSFKYFWIYLSALLVIPWMIAGLITSETPRLSLTDRIVIVFWIYVIADGWLLHLNLFENKKALMFSSSVIAYFFVRLITADTLVAKTSSFFLSVSFLGTMIIAIFFAGLQLTGLFHSFNFNYTVTGTFLHPAPFAGYLSSLFPLAFVIFIVFARRLRLASNSTAFLMWLSGVFIVLTLLVAPVLASRSSQVSLFGGVCYCTFRVPYLKMRINKFLTNWLKSIYVKVVLPVSFLGVLFFTYHIRQSSADGRLLVWKISCRMLVDRPVFGWGMDQFKNVYPIYQLRYFKGGDYDERDIQLADDVSSAFNEPLQLACELGCVGFMLIFLMIISTFWQARHVRYGNNIYGISAKGGLISFIIFSFFSYPFSLPELTSLFFILLAFAQVNYTKSFKQIERGKTHPVFAIFIMVIAMFLIVQFSYRLRDFSAYKTWLSASTDDDYNIALKKYASTYYSGFSNELFAMDYVRVLRKAGKYSSSMNVLNSLPVHNYNYFLLRGEGFLKLGNSTAAEADFKNAHYILPNRLYPLYYLMEITGNRKKLDGVAKGYAEAILKLRHDQNTGISKHIIYAADSLLADKKIQNHN